MDIIRKAMKPPSRSGSPLNSEKSESVKVCVRLKDENIDTLDNNNGSTSSPWCIDNKTTPNKIYLAQQYSEKFRKPSLSHSYDAVLTGSDNSRIYNTIAKEIVNSAMDGFHGTEEEPGIIPQAVDNIFKYIKKAGNSKEFLLRVTYLEIYNEVIRDLLATETVDLKIHEDKYRGVFVAPLKEEIVTSPKQVMRVIDKGEANRHVSSNDYHEHSSRSHTVFQIIIESCDNRTGTLFSTKRRGLTGSKKDSMQSGIKLSYLNLIDLAGSEKFTSNLDRRKEAAFINKSLLTLGAVIFKISESKPGHIPFRDSKLTRILQTTLSGNCRIGVICTINSAGRHFEESVSTLKFGSRIKIISTKAQRNQVVDDKALLQKYLDEINELKAKLTTASSAIDQSKSQELESLRQQNQKYEEEMMEMHLARTTYKERIDHLTKLILSSSSMGDKVFKRSRPMSVHIGHRSSVSVNPRLSFLGKHRDNNERLDWAMNDIKFKNRYIQELESLFSRLSPENPESPSIEDIFTRYNQIQNLKASWEDDTNEIDSHSDKVITEKVSSALTRVASMRQSRLFTPNSNGLSPLSLELPGYSFDKPFDEPKTPVVDHTTEQNPPASEDELKEMNDIIEDQNKIIMELEQERKYNAKIIADLKDRIRQLELQQFRRAEKAALDSSEPPISPVSYEKLQKRISELELALGADSDDHKRSYFSGPPSATSNRSFNSALMSPPIPPPRSRPSTAASSRSQPLD